MYFELFYIIWHNAIHNRYIQNTSKKNFLPKISNFENDVS